MNDCDHCEPVLCVLNSHSPVYVSASVYAFCNGSASNVKRAMGNPFNEK